MKTTKKLLAVVIAAVMLLGVMPLSVFADDVVIAPKGVWVAGVKVDSDKEAYWVSDGAGGITDVGASAEKYNVKYIPAITEEVENKKGQMVTEVVEPAVVTLKNITLSKALQYKTANYSYYNTLSAVIFTENKVAVTIVVDGSIVINAEAGYGLNLGAESTVKGRGKLDISNVGTGISGTAIIDGPKVSIKADYAFGNSESAVKKGTLEAIGTIALSSSSYYELSLHDSRRCTVKLNAEATADGAKRWTGDDDPIEMDDGIPMHVRDMTVETKGFKYIKVSYYPEPIATMIVLMLQSFDLAIVFGKGLFIRMPLQIYNVVKIIIENIGDISDAYN
ncbi:MAG: hypothetical protein IJF40_01610 [Clostridia bacterium]|nr:hypothetical protein [Clostridia bacterium]